VGVAYFSAVVAPGISLDNSRCTFKAETSVKAFVEDAVRLIFHANNAFLVCAQIGHFAFFYAGSIAIFAVFLNQFEQSLLPLQI
jgi:hypothetical protein